MRGFEMFQLHRSSILQSGCLALLAILGALAGPAGAVDFKPERDDTNVTESAEVPKSVYRIEDANDDGVLHIRGDGITIDFQLATLDGSPPDAKPDEFHGRGIVIEDSDNVVLRNLTLRGYKHALYARNCKNLTIEGCDFSDNWKQHLLSTPQAENGTDWLFGHENDANEWFRYGAAVYLESCAEFTVRNCVARRGQNGLCLVRSNDGAVYDNDFSFNSGWGLAMYRACRNRIAHNKLDWCIRGYSHGVYNRGQDSAGIFVFEQCSDNLFAYNSATHGGDGFFLFAGLETLDETGAGGCNGNLVYRNDFSHASNNGIEATFSTGNLFIENIMDEADHAVWAGYSYGSQFIGNKISRCNHGMSIEHGSRNRIDGNTFDHCGVAVNLWAGEKSSLAEKPYGRDHHCRSEEYTIVRNRFHGDKVDIRLGNTSDVTIAENDMAGAPTALEVNGRSRGVNVDGNNIDGEGRASAEAEVTFGRNYFKAKPPAGANLAEAPLTIDFEKRDVTIEPPDVPGELDAYLSPGTLRGLRHIFVDEWGPYDFARVKLVPESTVFWNEAELRVLGPEVKYQIKEIEGGVNVTPLGGTLPAVLRVTAPDRKLREFSFIVELPERGESLPVRGLLLFADWDVKFYGWKGVGPQKPPADWDEVLDGPVLEERKLGKLDFAWGGGAPSDKVPADHFATVSTTDLELPAGRYELRTVSDDGVRVSIDGRLAIDNWTWHPPVMDRAEVDLEQGPHAIRIEHFEIDGVAQLQFSLTPKPEFP
ncbi:MAG TPA: right-handed parallel beta-helix repeat-containing protein [Pirellulales bacterium]|nr:right-handed parallel beta-helix repeat-containing protein [Pirellulales bacterium]